MEPLFEQVESAVLRKLFRYLASDDVSREVEAFLDANCDGFEGCISDLVEEQDLERHDLYRRYCGLLDRQLGAFCAMEGMTQKEVFQECNQECSQDGQASMASMLLDMLLAATDYQAFCLNMSTFKQFKVTRERMLREDGAESKLAEDDLVAEDYDSADEGDLEAKRDEGEAKRESSRKGSKK